MITIELVKTTDLNYYNFVEHLLLSAFPQEERRELDLQRDFTDNNSSFYNNIVLGENAQPVGFITYWDFDDFFYVEHFAISPDARNGGYGKKVLEALHQKLGKPVVLEVEMPEDEMSKRRIGFYNRMGYVVWEKDYKQPPYRAGDGFLPMYIMALGDLNPEKDFERVVERLYKEVYLVK